MFYFLVERETRPKRERKEVSQTLKLSQHQREIRAFIYNLRYVFILFYCFAILMEIKKVTIIVKQKNPLLKLLLEILRLEEELRCRILADDCNSTAK